MEEPASGWFLFWASRTPAEGQTWGPFTRDTLAHFEASNYQAVLRQKLRQLRQRATQAYVKLQNSVTLCEAMDQAAKYEMSHFGGERKPGREKTDRDQRFRGAVSSSSHRDRKPLSKRPYRPGHYAPAGQTKEGPVCCHCKKPGHFKRDWNKRKNDQGNEQPHQ
ncbi:hypothetical protein PC110_g15898 [Phytophthora cactorum]|uniref:Uncharacterized protein n=2 Tax=Phytophthora cactorum TaxID=29920 RepID=A0A329RTT8_9STRA|nr:hypothetical protein C6341_g14737 [Phytophthora cactorum]KAG4041820.1 hypothetical protein PC123_g22669 [Phytophthora cactorum]RAW27710.1 hypothetical protein PC110_g15898 [Phytophthora cactorum]